MIFGCTPETYHESLSRQLFGFPVYPYKPQVKARLVEDCPVLHEREFKDVIRENYKDAKKFSFFLSQAQVCSLKFLFRQKAVEDWPLSRDQNHGRRVVHYCPVGPQQTRSSIQVISSVSKDEVEKSKTFLISALPLLPKVHAFPSYSRSCSLGGLEVSICAQDKEDKKRNCVSDSPRRHVVMYETRKEQLIAPVLKSKIIKPDRQKVVEEVFQSRPSKGLSHDRKRRVDVIPHGVQKRSKGHLVIQEQGQVKVVLANTIETCGNYLTFHILKIN